MWVEDIFTQRKLPEHLPNEGYHRRPSLFPASLTNCSPTSTSSGKICEGPALQRHTIYPSQSIIFIGEIVWSQLRYTKHLKPLIASLKRQSLCIAVRFFYIIPTSNSLAQSRALSLSHTYTLFAKYWLKSTTQKYPETLPGKPEHTTASELSSKLWEKKAASKTLFSALPFPGEITLPNLIKIACDMAVPWKENMLQLTILWCIFMINVSNFRTGDFHQTWSSNQIKIN